MSAEGRHEWGGAAHRPRRAAAILLGRVYFRPGPLPTRTGRSPLPCSGRL